MSDLSDRQKLLALVGDQKCACCDVEPLREDEVDVVDDEVLCMDCVAGYHPDVYLRRGGDAA